MSAKSMGATDGGAVVGQDPYPHIEWLVSSWEIAVRATVGHADTLPPLSLFWTRHGLVWGVPPHGRGLELDDLKVLSNSNHSVILRQQAPCLSKASIPWEDTRSSDQLWVHDSVSGGLAGARAMTFILTLCLYSTFTPAAEEQLMRHQANQYWITSFSLSWVLLFWNRSLEIACARNNEVGFTSYEAITAKDSKLGRGVYTIIDWTARQTWTLFNNVPDSCPSSHASQQPPTRNMTSPACQKA